jgi:predicted enzyme related to lactoylglutathione lyase
MDWRIHPAGGAATIGIQMRPKGRAVASEGALGKVVNGPMEAPNGQWIAHGLDPQSAKFALVGPKR